MCGLNGIFAYNPAASAPNSRELIATRDAMAVRGPDGFGEWWSEDRRLGLGHRRLSIIDLSDRAAQPMLSADSRLAIVFNGEVYNSPELRKELKRQGRTFKTTSDTEVLLHLYDCKGVDMVSDLRGMFAFALWDRAEKTLLLARDPFGIKPLYLADDGKCLRFASQVKALLAGGAISREPDPAGAAGFFLTGSIPEPFTLYRDICSFPAGHTMVVRADGPLPTPVPYVSIPAEIAAGAEQTVSENSVRERVRAAVRDSVRAHLLADVDVGLFLSAGVDSSALLGIMQDVGVSQLRTITLGFECFRGTGDDEVPLATAVAKHYGADHTVRRVNKGEFEEDLPAILDAMDQPSIDGVNSWFIAKAAKEAGLKVAISGLGGDEMLGGYPSFRQVPRIARLIAPFTVLAGAGKALRILLSSIQNMGSKPKLSGLLEYGGNIDGAFLLRRALFLPFELDAVLAPEVVREGLERLGFFTLLREMRTPDPGFAMGRVAALELGAYTRPQLLRDSDWAGMAHSLEIRTPLLDIRLLRDLAPIMAHLRGATGKEALGAAPRTELPKAIVRRPKSGFAVPTGLWMRETAERADLPVQTKGLASRAWARFVYESQVNEQNHLTAAQLAKSLD